MLKSGISSRHIEFFKYSAKMDLDTGFVISNWMQFIALLGTRLFTPFMVVHEPSVTKVLLFFVMRCEERIGQDQFDG